MNAPQKFYAPEGESSGNDAGSNAPTTLTYNYGGEEITVDLSNPEQTKLAQDRLSKGHNMEKIAEERNKLKEKVAQLEKAQEQVDAWNQRLDAARSNPSEFEALVDDLESYLGKPLSRQQKQDLLDGDNFDDSDPVAKELKSLRKELNDYKQQQEQRLQDEVMKAEVKQLLSKLDAMENDTEKYPGFDREKVYEAARQKGTTDFEMVYYFLNRENYEKSIRDQIEKEYKELTDKRKAAGTETDTTPASLREPPKTFKRMEDVGRSALEDMKKEGKSFFSE